MATIKEINHDSSQTLSVHYDTIVDTGSRLTVTNGSALSGSTNGIDASQTNNTDSTLLEAFTAISGTEFRLRFRIDLSNLTVSGSQQFFKSMLRNTASTDKHGIVINALVSGNFNISGRYIDDPIGPRITDTKIFTQPISDPICVELRAIRETADGNNDGIVEFIVDGISIDLITNAQNFNAWTSGGNMDEVFNNFRGSINFSGNFYFDEWILDDDDAADLGCPPLFSGYDLVLGGGLP